MLTVFLAVAVASAPDLLYRQAIDTMQALPQPTYATYRVEIVEDGLGVDFAPLDGNIWIDFPDRYGKQLWTVKHRTSDYESEINNSADGRRYVSARSFFDPTWYGTYRAIHEGMLLSQDVAPPRPQGTPTPQPVLKTIAQETVTGASTYAVEDRGSAVCPNGNAGHALHVQSIARIFRHQLSDVVIETRSNRFCVVRFSIAELNENYSIEQHYAEIGGYWMQSDGFIEESLHDPGTMIRHGVWRYTISDMEFPVSLPNDTWARTP